SQNVQKIIKIYPNGYPHKLWILLGKKGLQTLWNWYF
ncbi:hypothetical protein J624_3929, partial [Acinetobacter baumannii 1062314]